MKLSGNIFQLFYLYEAKIDKEFNLNLSPQERSKYFKGLLILMIKDRKIEAVERDILVKVGNLLGFERKFCENAINDSLENEFLLDDIPSFSNVELAKSFIEDGLKLAFSDKELNPDELQYLRLTIGVNNIEEDWFIQHVKDSVIKIDDSNYFSNLSVSKYL